MGYFLSLLPNGGLINHRGDDFAAKPPSMVPPSIPPRADEVIE